MEIALPGLIFFDPHGKTEHEKRHIGQSDAAPRREQRLFCAQCHHTITNQHERIPVQGSHEHTFTNPHGITFHIGCFCQAQGCGIVGTATMADTWFEGYAWRIAVCANCATHLGWQFASSSDVFYGLIVNRLTSAGPGRE